MRELKEILKTYTKKPYVTITKRGNAAIKTALKLAKHLGYKHCYIPDWGGWMTYEQFATELKFTIHKIKTTDEIIEGSDLFFEPNSVLLIHSLAGYHHKLDSERIAKACKKTRTLFINDISGLVGKETKGDVIIGSFGKAKPVDYGEGGFVACLSKIWFERTQIDEYELEPHKVEELITKLKSIHQRYEFLYKKRDELKPTFQDSGFQTIGDEHALVIIVPYETDEQKEQITKICEDNNVEYTECPRYIRTAKKAISVEIKRLRE